MSKPAPKTFNPSLYPRSYAVSLGWKLFLGIGSLAILVGSCVGIGYFGTGHEVRSVKEAFWFSALLFPMALLGLWGVVAVFRSRITLTRTAIEWSGAVRTSRMERGDIVGFRIQQVQGNRSLVLTPREGRKKRISLVFKRDSAFEAWFAGLRNYDQEELAASLREAEQDTSIGASPRERVLRLASAKRVARVLGYVTLACLLWANFPRPYELVIGVNALLPWLAIVLCWKFGGTFTIADPGKNSVRADLTLLVFMPGLALAIRALNDVALVDPWSLAAPVVGGSILFLVIAALACPGLRQKKASMALLLVLMTAYPGGLIPIVDAYFDKGSGTSFEVTILGKHRTTGKGASQYFALSQWGPFTAGKSVHAYRDLYERHSVGDVICARLHPGSLGLAWYSVDDRLPCNWIDQIEFHFERGQKDPSFRMIVSISESGIKLT